jgi:hypothetical protein
MKLYIAIGILAMRFNPTLLFYFPHPSLHVTLETIPYSKEIGTGLFKKYI